MTSEIANQEAKKLIEALLEDDKRRQADLEASQNSIANIAVSLLRIENTLSRMNAHEDGADENSAAASDRAALLERVPSRAGSDGQLAPIVSQVAATTASISDEIIALLRHIYTGRATDRAATKSRSASPQATATTTVENEQRVETTIAVSPDSKSNTRDAHIELSPASVAGAPEEEKGEQSPKDGMTSPLDDVICFSDNGPDLMISVDVPEDEGTSSSNVNKSTDGNPLAADKATPTSDNKSTLGVSREASAVALTQYQAPSFKQIDRKASDALLLSESFAPLSPNPSFYSRPTRNAWSMTNFANQVSAATQYEPEEPESPARTPSAVSSAATALDSPQEAALQNPDYGSGRGGALASAECTAIVRLGNMNDLLRKHLEYNERYIAALKDRIPDFTTEDDNMLIRSMAGDGMVPLRREDLDVEGIVRQQPELSAFAPDRMHFCGTELKSSDLTIVKIKLAERSQTFKVGDRVRAVNGHDVETREELIDIVTRIPVGAETVTVAILRDGMVRTVRVLLASPTPPSKHPLLNTSPSLSPSARLGSRGGSPQYTSSVQFAKPATGAATLPGSSTSDKFGRRHTYTGTHQ